jgi:hypothetical protein
MPAYSATAPITAIYPGDKKTVWSVEQPLTGTTSDRVAIGGTDVSMGQPGQVSIEIKFSGAPGAFQIDAQTADTDTDAAYVSEPGSSLTTVNAGNYGRIELWPVVGKFVRLIMTTQTGNAVNATATIGR